MTIKLRKGGKIVRVTENELDKYITKGYTRVDVETKVNVAPSVPREPIDEKIDAPEEIQPKSRTTRRNKRSQ